MGQTETDAEILAALANGVIPADERDEGAAAVNVGPRLAEKLAAGVNVAVYRRGLAAATELARAKYGRDVTELDPPQTHELLGALREQQPGFFKQLRMDVCALYLSDPNVWARIGFPGPSSAQGGYPDFDIPQALSQRILTLDFSETDKARMHELAVKNQEGQISPDELQELDNYVKAGDLLALLQSKARRALL
jgi:hypothetical protein